MSAHPGWLGHPLAQALLHFNLMSGSGMTRNAVVEEGPDEPSSVRRHRAAAWLRESALEPATDLGEPALPLAMLPEPAWGTLQRLLGAALHAPQLRRTIAREQRETLLLQLGSEGMAMARAPLAQALAGLPGATDWCAERAHALCVAWGAGLLSLAFDHAPPPVGRRARLRLPADAQALGGRLADGGLTSERALAAARDLLHALEPAWLSSFPSRH